MPRLFTSDEYKDILEVYIQCNCISRAAEREYRERFGRERNPSFMVFQHTYQRFRETGSVLPLQPEHVRNDRNADAVLELVTNEPTISTRRIAARTGIPRSSAHRYLQAEGWWIFARPNITIF